MTAQEAMAAALGNDSDLDDCLHSSFHAEEVAARILAALSAAGWELVPTDIPASGAQTARLCAKPDFGRKMHRRKKSRA